MRRRMFIVAGRTGNLAGPGLDGARAGDSHPAGGGRAASGLRHQLERVADTHDSA
jgi:hypothetical protein